MAVRPPPGLRAREGDLRHAEAGAWMFESLGILFRPGPGTGSRGGGGGGGDVERGLSGGFVVFPDILSTSRQVSRYQSTVKDEMHRLRDEVRGLRPIERVALGWVPACFCARLG